VFIFIYVVRRRIGVQCHERRDVARCHLKMSLETRAEDRRRCKRVNLTTSTSTATTTMKKTARTVPAYRGRLRSLKERTKWCKSSSVAHMHARCNALATDLEIVSSTPTHADVDYVLRLFMSCALFCARDNEGQNRVNKGISVQSATRTHPWNQTTIRWTRRIAVSFWTFCFCTIFNPVAKSSLIKMQTTYFSHTCLIRRKESGRCKKNLTLNKSYR
jgi:hypothetical protein